MYLLQVTTVKMTKVEWHDHGVFILNVALVSFSPTRCQES